MALTAKKVYAILKRQISDMEAKLNSPVRYRGTVATADLLPLNPDIGDMYNIESKSVYGEAGMNVAWNGVVWDTMGAPIDMSLYIKSSELADWVKQQNKPTYTAEEVGALPADTKIPSKTSDLQNDSGFLTKVPDSYLNGTDTTLKESGKAADAKATGDKFTEMSADISKKLDKNQGSENSGKIAGINESGDIVPMFPVGVEYNEETNCLEFGSDQGMKLNQGIGLDSTLTKTGFAADAGVTGKEINSLKESNRYKTVINNKIDFNGQTAVFFGDSITEGITSIDGQLTVTQNNYVKFFNDAVNFSQYANKGLRGQAYSIGTKFETYIRETNLNPYNYLFIAGGINDWVNGVPLITFKDSVNSCFDYIKSISHFTGVFVISPINYATTANSGGDSHIADVTEYRQILFDSAIAHGFNFIDTDNFSLDSSIGNSEFLGDPIWYKQFSDGVHPTEIGYYIFGKELANTLIHCPVLGNVYLQAKSNFTGKYWYDTNAIYEYVLVDSMSAESVALPVTDFDVNGIAPLSITGFIKRKSDNIEFPVGYYESDGTFIRYRMLNNSFYLYVSKDLVGGTTNLVFKYTKGR